MTRTFLLLTVALSGLICSLANGDTPADSLIRSGKSGLWSDPTTWIGGKTPLPGDRVQIRASHIVIFDVQTEKPIRFIHIAGVLAFASDRDTRLDVGLIKIQPGNLASEDGFDCDAHAPTTKPGEPRPALEVGTSERPIPAARTAMIRLHLLDGMDRKSCPAIICCGGRMDFHGAPLSHAWVKLGESAKKGSTTVTAADSIAGWRIGDRVVVTATHSNSGSGSTRRPGAKRQAVVETEERTIATIDGSRVSLDRPLQFDHAGVGDFRGELANLSRNVVVESADPKTERGHTMYHRGSAGSISYAEFRHLGKEGQLGRYSLHFHQGGDTMRGSSVVGASIWDSANRWLTVHGTNYLVVRDCVGYQSVGHGYFLEDGTEVHNVFDRNLAVQAFTGKTLPKQALPFDANEGAGFWWANCLNTFTRNVTCENDRYGYRFEATPGSRFNPTLPIQQPDGTHKAVDIRTLPFVRFDNNEAHCDGLYGFNLGDGVNRIGPDVRHPMVVRNMKIWEVHYAFRPQSPMLLVENMKIHRAAYGIYHPNYDHHVYRNLTIHDTNTEPFNRGHDDFSVQYGPLTVDGLTFSGMRSSGMPMIQLSDDNPTDAGVTHIRNLRVIDIKGQKRAWVNLGGGPRPQPTTPHGVPVYIHDYFGPGRHAKVVSTRAKDLISDGNEYRDVAPITGDESRAAEVRDVEFPDLLKPVDDLPPTTVVTRVLKRDGKTVVLGTTADNGSVKRVVVNGVEATAVATNFTEWRVVLDPVAEKIEAHAEDAAGNVEKRRHVVMTSR